MTDILTDIQLRLAGVFDRFADHGDGGRAAEDLRATATCILSLISERRANGITSVDVDEKTWERLLDLSARHGASAPQLVARALRILLKDEPGVCICWAPEVQAALDGGYITDFQRVTQTHGYAHACETFRNRQHAPNLHAELVKRALARQIAEQGFTPFEDFEDVDEWKERARKQLTALADAELLKIIGGVACPVKITTP